MLDRICHAYYGASQGMVEAVLAANPALRRYDAVLPAGVEITLPEATAPDAPSVRLYD